MGDPFLIQGPAVISFSGGRTSAMMLRRIIDAHAGCLPDQVKVAFCNTGKERAETLEFVRRCGAEWDVEIVWLEWTKAAPGWRAVCFETASRDGAPFDALIAGKSYLPNWQARFCTQYLKVLPLHAFAASFGFENYAEVVGLRADEPWRIAKMKGRNVDDGRLCVAPMSSAGLTVRDVAAFWRAQPFDLGLLPGEGNCDLCFMKGAQLRKSLIRANPESATWWIEAEAKTGGFFDRRTRYAELAAEVVRQPAFDFEGQDEEHDAECGLWCAPEEQAA